MRDHSPRSLAEWILVAGMMVQTCACAPPPEIRWMSPPQSAPDPALHPATQRWGELRVRPGVFEADTGIRPWSGYWYPLQGDEIDPILKKYDFASESSALEWQRLRRSQQDGPLLPWEGRCDAWAFASLLIPEPRSALQVRGVTFEPWEQQALWIHAFEQLAPQSRMILGHRNSGEGDSPYEDLLPMELHKTLDHVLRQEGRPLILDRDPRPPVWNTPIWGARWEISPSSSLGWWAVSLDLYGVLPWDEPTPRVERRGVILHYDYRLRIEELGDGWARVVDSEWVGRSKGDHPDFITLPASELWRDSGRGSGLYRSDNPELKTEWLETHFK